PRPPRPGAPALPEPPPLVEPPPRQAPQPRQEPPPRQAPQPRQEPPPRRAPQPRQEPPPRRAPQPLRAPPPPAAARRSLRAPRAARRPRPGARPRSSSLYLHLLGLLGRVRVVGPGVDLELAELSPPEPCARQHALHRGADDLLRAPLEHVVQRARSEAAGVARVAVVALLLALVARHRDLL